MTKPSAALTFTLNLGPGSQDFIDIAYPIIRATEKAVLIKTSGGQLWCPLFKLALFIKNAGGKYATRRDALVKWLNDITSTSGDTLHRVWKSGKGTSEKSHKYKIAVIRAVNYQHGIETIISRRTFTLPVSQIRKNEEGKWMAPRWLILKRLDKGESLPRVTWAGLAETIREIDDAVAQLEARVEARDQEWKAAKLKAELEKQAKHAALAQRLNAIRNAAPLALKFCKTKFTLAKMREAGAKIDYWPRCDIEYIEKTIAAPGSVWNIMELEEIVAVAQAQAGFSKWCERQVKAASEQS